MLPSDQDWRIFSCKNCQMWLYAVEALKKQISMPLLNLEFTKSRANQELIDMISRRFVSEQKLAELRQNSEKYWTEAQPGHEQNSRIRVGLLSFRDGPKVSIKAPVLRKIGLEELNF